MTISKTSYHLHRDVPIGHFEQWGSAIHAATILKTDDVCKHIGWNPDEVTQSHMSQEDAGLWDILRYKFSRKPILWNQ